jgi:hypothetical protein
VSQPLVREGDFAVALARGLVNGSIAGENEAESELASLGIAPRNGWISDYPVTPDILGELKESVAGMADSGKLSVSGPEASAVVDSVGSRLGLYVQTARGIDTAAGPPPEVPPDEAGPAVPGEPVEDYYDGNGPPVVSYYAPPYDYAYLYCWVPYPFLWTGFWFPGFFVLNDFDIVVIDHHHHHPGPFPRVTNHVVDRASGSVARINPATRSSGSSAVVAGRSGAGLNRASASAIVAARNSKGAANNAASRPTSPRRSSSTGTRVRTDSGRSYGGYGRSSSAGGGRGGYSGTGGGGSPGGGGGSGGHGGH